MTSRSSIFSFDTLKPSLNRVRGLSLSFLLAGAVVGACELGARALRASGKIEEDKSLRLLVEDRIEEIDTQRPSIWMLGNSTLGWGIDEKQFEAESGEKIVKLSHGSATVKGSAEMLAYYFRHTTARPTEVIVTVTKDDLNANGSRAKNSTRYVEINSTDQLPMIDPLVLRNARTDLREKALPLVFVQKQEKVAAFDGKPLPMDDSFLNKLVDNFEPRVDWLTEVKATCDKAGVKKVTVLLLPVTDRNAQFHDAKVGTPTYAQVREMVVERCKTDGINLIDWATPRTDYKRFRDSYHLNPAGMAWQTHRLTELRAGRESAPVTKPTSAPAD